MAVIPFPDRHSPAAPVRNVRELSNVIHANEDRGRTACVENNDAVRRFAVILDWESGEVLEKTTAQFRESFEKRSVAHWA